MTNTAKRYLSRLTNDERWELLIIALDRLKEVEEVSFRQDDVDCEECFFWDGSGENLLKDQGASHER